MTKARLHPALLEFWGAMGDMVFKKRGNKIYVSMKPKKGTKKASKAQLARRKVFRKAVYYAKTAMANEATRAFYKAIAAEKEREARPLCVADYLNAPTIEELDVSKYQGNVGDRILIMTYDDVGVVKVNVTLTNRDGMTIETGRAVEQGVGSGNWEYTATVSVPPGSGICIEAEAYDRPANRAIVSTNFTVGVKK
jgi:hypothetical protein